MLSPEMLKRALMTNEEIGDKKKIRKIRTETLENAESSFEWAIAKHMAMYGTY